MRKTRQISSVVLNISLIILIYFTLGFSLMQIKATSDCMEYGAPRAVVTSQGVICVRIMQGAEYAAPISRIREELGK